MKGSAVTRNVLITGAAGGVGFGVAEYLAAQGHNLILVDLDASAITKAAEQLSRHGRQAKAIALDVCDNNAVAQLPVILDGMVIDVLVNNAGIQHVSRLESFPAEKWQQLINVMLVGPALLSQAVLPGMREQNFGRIINIGSIHSKVASPYKTAYVAAKHGLIGFAKSLALETGDVDITVNTLCPAYIKTRLVEQQIKAQAEENGISEQQVIDDIMLAPMPKKRFIDIDEIAATVAFLMTDAARNITAQAIGLDGGWTAR